MNEDSRMPGCTIHLMNDSTDDGKVLLLWDVDHTLIENSGVSKESYALAFEKLTNKTPKAQPRTDGRTDREIMRNLFTANDEDFTVDHENGIVPALLEASKELVPALLNRGYMLPGTLAALERLSKDSSVVQSALTGNIKPNAENKLKLLGDHVKYLDLEVGGFGSDDIVRSNLVAVAQRRASEKYEFAFDSDNTILIGDTTRDVDAAIKGGGKIIAVATGVYSETDLREAGAHAVLPDLSNFDRFVEALIHVSNHEISV